MFTITMKAARVNRGITIKEAAKDLGIGERALYNYEAGITSPPIQVGMAMAKLYDVPLDMLDFGMNTSSEKTNK